MIRKNLPTYSLLETSLIHFSALQYNIEKTRSRAKISADKEAAAANITELQQHYQEVEEYTLTRLPPHPTNQRLSELIHAGKHDDFTRERASFTQLNPFEAELISLIILNREIDITFSKRSSQKRSIRLSELKYLRYKREVELEQLFKDRQSKNITATETQLQSEIPERQTLRPLEENRPSVTPPQIIIMQQTQSPRPEEIDLLRVRLLNEQWTTMRSLILHGVYQDDFRDRFPELAAVITDQTLWDSWAVIAANARATQLHEMAKGTNDRSDLHQLSQHATAIMEHQANKARLRLDKIEKEAQKQRSQEIQDLTSQLYE